MSGLAVPVKISSMLGKPLQFGPIASSVYNSEETKVIQNDVLPTNSTINLGQQETNQKEEEDNVQILIKMSGITTIEFIQCYNEYVFSRANRGATKSNYYRNIRLLINPRTDVAGIEFDTRGNPVYVIVRCLRRITEHIVKVMNKAPYLSGDIKPFVPDLVTTVDLSVNLQYGNTRGLDFLYDSYLARINADRFDVNKYFYEMKPV